MIVDCDRCEVRGNACKDCVITVLLGAPPGGIELDGAERGALATLADVGMVPRLRLVNRLPSHGTGQAGAESRDELLDRVERSTRSGERSRRHAG